MVVLRLAAKNVARKKERSLLTILGVLLAVGSFVALLSLADGLSAVIRRETVSRAVQVYVSPKSALPLPLGPVGSIGAVSETIPEKLVAALAKVEGVTGATGITRLQVTVGRDPVLVWGLNPPALANFFPGMPIAAGTTLREGTVCVLGSDLAQRLGLGVGGTLSLGGAALAVAGVSAHTGTLSDQVCFVPLDLAQTLQKTHGVQEIWLQTRDLGQASAVADQIAAAYPALAARSWDQFQQAALQYAHLAWLLQFGIASIGVLIALSAAMNTMLMSTFERMREFAVLRAIGATRRMVFGMVLWESVILCGIGGVLGLVLGILGSRLLDEAVRVFLGIPFPLAQCTPALFLEALGISGLIGIVGALVPAIVVYRMRIVPVLRGE